MPASAFSQLPYISDRTLYKALEDPLNAPTISELPLSAALEERPFLDKATASLLNSAIQIPKQISDSITTALDNERLRRQTLYQDPPVLGTDHNTDVRTFTGGIEPDLENEFLPLEDIDVENDEGFTWPMKVLDLPDRIWDGVRAEKVEVSKCGVEFLMRAIKGGGGGFMMEGTAGHWEGVLERDFPRVSRLMEGARLHRG